MRLHPPKGDLIYSGGFAEWRPQATPACVDMSCTPGHNSASRGNSFTHDSGPLFQAHNMRCRPSTTKTVDRMTTVRRVCPMVLRANRVFARQTCGRTPAGSTPLQRPRVYTQQTSRLRPLIITGYRPRPHYTSPSRRCQPNAPTPREVALQPPRVTFRPVVVSLRGPGRSPVLPFACCVGSLRSVGRCGRCSCRCRFRVRGAQ